ncbi:major facilitator superfamily domain-containing protein [Boeremia exigua]|uniref:major facilitator superfamily domain-containing protein n=1 Tax=Boeremia exigua TaxID=749465 RepID=UPI001E8EE262|nr:major facilitator superfamily domain-containing protein [Boeremia exigua]KAH6643766.1 major facilitator superfamily domain-containing protein [Boeremia exigua]
MSTTMATVTEAVELQTISKSNIPKSSLHNARLSAESARTLGEPHLGGIFESDSSLTALKTKTSNLQTFLTIFTPSFVGFIASFTNGVITIGLPEIARSLSLDRSLYLWPSSVYGLTSGACLLIAGSIADIVGARPVELLGITLIGTFTLACGFSSTGEQLVVFRALQGVALAMHLPASVALISGAVPSGRARNFGFACLGFSQPLGFAAGLVISGVLVEKAGWRSGFYLAGGALLTTAVAAFWSLPNLKPGGQGGLNALAKKVGKEVDWVGGIISSGGLAILAYVLAILSADLTTIRSAETISLLTVSVVLLLAFPAWMRYRERTNKSALVPNKLWKNIPFTSTCIMVALSYGVMNSIELFSSLYFQEIQKATPLTTSLYLLPNLGAGVLINILVGTFVHKIPAFYLVTVSAVICSVSPLFMALLDPSWNYFYLAFWAQAFAPFSADVLFTVGLIIISDSFPERDQALAGAVFNTVAQFGMSLGMGSCQVVALGVIGNDEGASEGGNGHGGSSGANDPMELLKGYRASFWTMFAYMLVCIVIAIAGLRKAGKVGLKKDQ